MFLRYILVVMLSIITFPVYAQNKLNLVYTISDDMGGTVSNYIRRALIFEASGTMVRFEGACYSACTIFMSDVFHYDKCMTPTAIFGFHKPYINAEKPTVQDYIDLETITKAMWNSFPTDVKSHLEFFGWPSVEDGADPELMTYMSAKDLENTLPYCE